jgi:hypothetical protein
VSFGHNVLQVDGVAIEKKPIPATREAAHY